ncbi:uncharacterized protein [Zea mays]|uniref:uncharacterized protein isoform X2 n=1 Tax=Zea mays TaxID=4577 RepID=UPI0009AA29B8|nr:uncharacterized protein LOC103650809 isoform X2 [Zea mays]|eukprot:XP_020405967.1 uncharacterized protein LOC103650809 isoform X2 [Zea mays]
MNLQLQQVGKQSSLHREVGKIPGGPTHAAEEKRTGKRIETRVRRNGLWYISQEDTALAIEEGVKIFCCTIADWDTHLLIVFIEEDNSWLRLQFHEEELQSTREDNMHPS